MCFYHRKIVRNCSCSCINTNQHGSKHLPLTVVQQSVITVDLNVCVVPGNTNPTHVVSTAVPSITCRGRCSPLIHTKTVDVLRSLVFFYWKM